MASAVPERSIMHDYAPVLNAGSSSLKFSVYWRPEAQAWALESPGQVMGIGTQLRVFARYADIRGLIDQRRSSHRAQRPQCIGRAQQHD